MSKSILSVLALAGNKPAAIASAAADLHAALFHLVHAGQATPLSDTLGGLPNRGKSAIIKAVVSDYYTAGLLYRATVKADGKLDKSGKFVGFQADNLPFLLVEVTEKLTQAVAVVKKVKAEVVAGDVVAPAPEADKSAEVIQLLETVHSHADSIVTLEAANLALVSSVAFWKEEAETALATVASLRAELTAALMSKAAAKPKGKKLQAA